MLITNNRNVCISKFDSEIFSRLGGAVKVDTSVSTKRSKPPKGNGVFYLEMNTRRKITLGLTWSAVKSKRADDNLCIFISGERARRSHADSTLLPSSEIEMDGAAGPPLHGRVLNAKRWARVG